MSNYHINALGEALRLLSNSPFLPAAVNHLRKNTATINTDLHQSVVAEIPAFSQSHNPDVLPDLARHSDQHTFEILRLLSGGQLSEFAFVRKHAQRRAGQRFPLEALLHAYRCGHKTFSRWLREAALATLSSPDEARQVVTAIADFTLEYTDAISTIAAKAYVAQVRLLADVAGDQRAELLTLLLDGYDESDGRIEKMLRNTGYLDRRHSFCVVLAQSVDPAEMFNSIRARRLAETIDKIFSGSRTRRLIDVRDNKVTIVFSDIRRTSGWTSPHTELAERLSPKLCLAGNAVLIGVSNDVPSTSQIPAAYRQALLALELANLTHRVIRFSELSTQQLMLHLAGEEFQRLLPAWANQFFMIDEKSGGALSKTLHAYANADMNTLKAAEYLSVHPNTIYSRFQKILDITGLQPRHYHALTELLIVSYCQPQAKTIEHK